MSEYWAKPAAGLYPGGRGEMNGSGTAHQLPKKELPSAEEDFKFLPETHQERPHKLAVVKQVRSDNNVKVALCLAQAVDVFGIGPLQLVYVYPPADVRRVGLHVMRQQSTSMVEGDCYQLLKVGFFKHPKQYLRYKLSSPVQAMMRRCRAREAGEDMNIRALNIISVVSSEPEIAFLWSLQSLK
jgi:hypothetical protein